MTRRNMLASLGGLVASSSLPAFGGDEVSLFPGRGRFERLQLGYQRIEIGLEKPFSVLHISDTHLTEAYEDEQPGLRDFADRRRHTFGGRQQEALRDSLAWAKNNVDYVLHTGDLIDFRSRANYDLVKKYYGGDAAIFGSTGNHEYQLEPFERKIVNSFGYNDESRHDLDRIFGFDTRFRSKVVNGVNFITLEQTYGLLCTEQVERFAAEVKKGLPIVLAMHAPLLTEKIWLASCKFWARSGKRFESAVPPDPYGDYKRQTEDPVTRDFLRYLRSEKLLKGILAGHLHISVQDRFSPTANEYVVGGNFLFHGEEVLFV